MTTQAVAQDGDTSEVDNVSKQLEWYTEMLVQARAASSEGQQILVVGNSHEVEARTHLKRARKAVRSGATCGDLAMDLTILIDTVYPERDSDTYRGASWLIEQLRLHPGELLVHQTNIQPGRSWAIGRIPVVNFPSLVLQDPSASAQAQQQEFWRDGIALTSSSKGHVSARSHSIIDRPVALELVTSVSRMQDPKRRQDLFVGDAAVHVLIASLTVEERFHFWVVTRLLGYPIGDDDVEVKAELQRRREAMIPQLIRASDRLIDYGHQLGKWQQRPAEFLALGSRNGGIVPTADGVIIDFGLAGPIEAAKFTLNRLIAVARADLTMDDNSTLQQAVNTAGS